MFITLTGAVTKKSIRININQVLFYSANKSPKTGSDVKVGSEPAYIVNETPEEIDKLILKAEEASAFVTARAYYQLR